MQQWLYLIAGGVLGTVGRFAVSGAVHRWAGHEFPYGTLAVNTLGCAVIGLIAVVAERKLHLTHETHLFLVVGMLGAFTTFSALIYESWRLMQTGQPLLAGVNLGGSIALGLVALWLGTLLGGLL